MKNLLFGFLLIAGFSHAEGLGPRLPDYYIQSNEIDSSLNENQIAFTITVGWNYAEEEVKQLLYADNGKMSKQKIKEERTFTFKSKPGKHVLEFSIGEHHQEIRTDSIEVQPRHHVKMRLSFKHSHYKMHVRKPVIYLYPQEKTNIEVKVEPVGEMVFVYPEFNESWNMYPKYDESWNFTATPDGKLNFGDQIFNYLFWESEQTVLTELINLSEGAIVKGNEVTAHLEEVLTNYGLSSQEQADFITYWVPQMKDANNLYIYLLFDDACDAFAELNIHPKPDQIGRIYMLWDEIEDASDIKLKPQEIPVLNRDGFTVIEWGGAQINYRIQGDRRL